MRITVIFGYQGPSRIVNWDKALLEFPKLFKYGGKSWEWFAYDSDKTGKTDYELIYSEIPTYDPNFYADMEDFESMFFGIGSEACTCGAAFSSFPFDHMRYCKMWKKW